MRSIAKARPANAVVTALCVVALAACSSTQSSGPAASSDGLLVATTVSPITSIAASIGGDRIRIEGIVPEEIGRAHV